MSLAKTIRRAMCLCPLFAVWLNAQPSPYQYFGQQPGERYGAAVTFLGDVDGDGAHEIAIGAPWYSENTTGGKIQVRGRAGGIVYESFGVSFAEQFGSSLDAVPDIDSDGAPELLVGAWGSSFNGFSAGRVYLLSGATGAEIWSRPGANAGDRFGFDVAYVGDTQGTGLPTVIVGAPGHNGGAGAAYILSAADGSVIHVLTASGPNEEFGYAVARGRSFNAGPEEDVLIGAPFADTNGTNSGHLYFVNGLTAASMSQVQGQPGSLLGFSVDGFDDVTGEGLNDYLVGAPSHTTLGLTSGRVVLRQSLNGGAAPITVLSGTQPGEVFGAQVASAGDRDGDGATDIICGGPGWDGPLGVNQGRIVVCNQSSQQLFFASGASAGEEFGSAIAGNGDYNGDGISDLIVGAPRYDSGSLLDVGRVVVYPAEGIVPYGTGLGGLNTIGLAASGSTNGGGVLHVDITGGPGGGVGQLGLALDAAQIAVPTPTGPLIMLIDPASLALPIPFGYDATGAFSISFYVTPEVVNLVGGSTVCGQVNGFNPASARLYASNAVAVTFGY